MSIPDRLRELRERAGLTVRAMADELKVPASSYAAYEDRKRFKREFLPVDKARAFAAVLTRHNVPRSDVLELAGIHEGDEAAVVPPSLMRSIWLRLLELEGVAPDRAEVLVDAAEEALRLSEALKDDADEPIRSRLAAQAVWQTRGLRAQD